MDMMIKQRLEEWGCNMQETFARFMNNENLYEKCLYKVLEDKNFTDLETAFKGGNAEEAFAIVHTLKGVLANMGIAPMCETVSAMVELLRPREADKLPEAEAYYPKLMEQYRYLESIIKGN